MNTFDYFFVYFPLILLFYTYIHTTLPHGVISLIAIYLTLYHQLTQALRRKQFIFYFYFYYLSSLLSFLSFLPNNLTMGIRDHGYYGYAFVGARPCQIIALSAVIGMTGHFISDNIHTHIAVPSQIIGTLVIVSLPLSPLFIC